jgi:nucleoside-diphosphate-sugar epimerase
MKIGFICPNLPGHINPMSALARHLRARGHDVVFLYASSANGLPCIPGDILDDMNANRLVLSIGDRLDPKQIGPDPATRLLLTRYHNWNC